MNTLYKNLLFIFLCLFSSQAFASGPNFNDTTNLPLTSGSNPNFSINVGISSASPGQKLDVQGTVRDVGEIVGAAGLTLGGVNETSWSAVTSNYWNYSASGNIGVSTTQAVGIGTTFVGGTGEATLSVMNGNVGIGTWMPGGALVVMNGNVGIGSTAPQDILTITPAYTANSAFVRVEAPYGGPFFVGHEIGAGYGGGSNPIFKATTDNATGSSNYYYGGYTNGTEDYWVRADGAGYFAGSVGINTSNPGSMLSVNGGASFGSYATTAAPSGGLIVSGNVGIGTGAPTGFEIEGTNVGIGTWGSPTGGTALLVRGNVGIGTAFVGGGGGEAALTVMNGNVGIGTWVPGMALAVMNGNVGIGTSVSYATLNVSGTSSVLGAYLTNAAEPATLTASAPPNPIVFKFATQSVLYYTSNATATWVINFELSAGTSLGTAMAVGQSITAAVLVTQGASGASYYDTAVYIDGTATGVTTDWQGGTAPAAGNATGIDVYQYTIVKTAATPTYTVLASLTQY